MTRSLSILTLAEIIQGTINGDGEIIISQLSAIENAPRGSLCFLERADAESIAKLRRSDASAVLVTKDFAENLEKTLIYVAQPKLAFAKAAGVIYQTAATEGVHQTALIAESAEVEAEFVGAFVSIGENSRIGKGSRIHQGVQIGANVEIGQNVEIFPNAVIYQNVKIGDNCTIHGGVVIGADGFGFVRDGANGYVKFPQIGTVEIGQNVEIGANTCIDRGALGATKIGDGTKIDNLVQIAHNVEIGRRVIIAAQTGISGSTIIEDDCVLAGQVGISEHAVIKKGAVIGAQAGVLPHKIVREGVWWGTPVQPLADFKRRNAMINGIERLREDVKNLKSKTADSSKNE